MTEQGYFKKITELSLKRSKEQKVKDEDRLEQNFVADNSDTIWLISNRCNLYQLRLHEVEETKASGLGIYLPSLLELEKDERIIRMLNPQAGYRAILNVFENGKVAKVELESYRTKGYRRKVQNAYGSKSPIVAVIPLEEDAEIVFITDRSTYLRVNTELISMVSSRSSQGMQVVRLAQNAKLVDVEYRDISDERYPDRATKIPRAPKKPETTQLELI